MNVTPWNDLWTLEWKKYVIKKNGNRTNNKINNQIYKWIKNRILFEKKDKKERYADIILEN